LLVDSRAPFRVVAEVVHTGAQQGYEVFVFAVRQKTAITALRLGLWQNHRSILRYDEAGLDLLIHLTTSGIGVSASRGNLASGCTGPGPGPAIPHRDGPDFAALTACLEKIKMVFVDYHVVNATLTAASETPFQTMVSAADATRATSAGKPLFPELYLDADESRAYARAASLVRPSSEPPEKTSTQIEDAPKPAPDFVSVSTEARGDVADATRVVRGMRAGFRACYRRGLEPDPQAKGEVTLTIRVGPGGEVSGVSAHAKGRIAAGVVNCIRARATAAAFSPPPTGSASIVARVTLGASANH